MMINHNQEQSKRSKSRKHRIHSRTNPQKEKHISIPKERKGKKTKGPEWRCEIYHQDQCHS